MAWYPDSGHTLILDGSALGNLYSLVIVIFSLKLLRRFVVDPRMNPFAVVKGFDIIYNPDPGHFS